MQVVKAEIKNVESLIEPAFYLRKAVTITVTKLAKSEALMKTY